MRYAVVSTKETDLVERHYHRKGQTYFFYYHAYLQSLALFVEQTQLLPVYEGMNQEVTP